MLVVKATFTADSLQLEAKRLALKPPKTATVYYSHKYENRLTRSEMTVLLPGHFASRSVNKRTHNFEWVC